MNANYAHTPYDMTQSCVIEYGISDMWKISILHHHQELGQLIYPFFVDPLSPGTTPPDWALPMGKLQVRYLASLAHSSWLKI